MARFAHLIKIARAGYGQYRGFRRFEAGRNDAAPQAFVDTLVELGPTFVKLGQVLSTRPDVLPEEYVDALERLQQDQPPDTFDVVRQTLETELGSPLEAHFSDIDSAPIAAASLAQVHRAKLSGSGRTVALKVQRPGLEGQIGRDLDAIELGLGWLRRLSPGRLERTNLVGFFEEFRRYTLQELDFANEGHVIDRFRANLVGLSDVRLPAVHWDQTTARVLTLDWVEGMRVGEAAERLDLSTRQHLVDSLVGVLMKMFISDGLFHADLHPGNIFFHDDGTFTLLDFGMYGELTDAQRDRFILYLIAVVQRQVRRAFHHFKAQTRELPGADEESFFRKFSELAEVFYTSPLSQMSFTRVYLEMMSAGYEYGFVFPSELMLHAKALTTAEALLFVLDPEMRFEQVARPIIAREFTGRASSLNLVRRRLSQFVPELLFLGEMVPAEAVDDEWDRQATDELADEFWRATMARMKVQFEQGALWKDLLERHFREVLADTPLAQECGQILDEVWDRYYELEPDLPVADSLGATFTTHLAVATLAVFEVLRDHGVERTRAYEIIYDTGWRLYTKMGEPPLLVASAYTRDPAKRLQIATDLFRFFPFGEPGYRRMIPSTGTRSPGRTSTRSPWESSSTLTCSVSPSTMRVALSGNSLASSLSAPWALEIERISIQWPSSMMVTSVASSHHKGEALKPSSTATLKTKATVIASEIKVIMPGIRSLSSPQALFKKTIPPYRKMTVPSTGSIHCEPGKLGAE
jgi:ubiquinone biosynthesis protein